MSQEINELAAALSLAQGEMKGAKKNSENPFFKSSYADLGEVIESYREPFAKHGLSLSQFAASADGKVYIKNLLMHKSGQWISYDPFKWEPQKRDIQSVGSLITYMRRYTAAGVVGIAQVDDDGNDAMPPKDNGNSAPPKKQYRGGSESKHEALPLYPGSELQKNVDQWSGLIMGGQLTAEQIINAIKSKYSLTPDQESTIRTAEQTINAIKSKYSLTPAQESTTKSLERAR